VKDKKEYSLYPSNGTYHEVIPGKEQGRQKSYVCRGFRISLPSRIHPPPELTFWYEEEPDTLSFLIKTCTPAV
jgi:hypothetical protein